MKTFQLIIGFLLSFYSLHLMAGAGHNHSHGHGHSHDSTPVSQSKAESNAENVIRSLVKREKIPQSWDSIKPNQAKKIKFNGRDEWQVIFFNQKIEEEKKQKLHVFLTLSGKFIAVNYSGK